MNKPVPSKEPRQSTARPAATQSATGKAAAAPASTTTQAADSKARAPQVSRPKVIEPSGVTHEQIAVRAYLIWQENGQAHGTDVHNWLEAERQLKAKR